ncbi:MAG: hypothetical protein JWN66_1817 [Sphingomonas bacterium]|nr:hypothetical protein [Sphingomonas bacterium]
MKYRRNGPFLIALLLETFRYDVDTGQHLSPGGPPPVAPSTESGAP